MQRFSNILVIADTADSHNAVFARAAHLAVRNRGMLTVASVVESLHDAATRVAARHSAVLCDLKLEGMMVQEERNRMESLVAPLRDAGVRVQVRILTGTPSIEIIREVVQHRHDLVIEICIKNAIIDAEACIYAQTEGGRRSARRPTPASIGIAQNRSLVQ